MRILSMSGFIPEQICDTIRFTGYKGEKNISHYCRYANDFISQVIHDKTIDGAVYPKSCDSSRIIDSYLRDCDKYKYRIVVPARNDSYGQAFFADEINRFADSINEHYATNFDEDTFRCRAEKVNERNSAIDLLYNRLESVSYYEYILAIHNEMMSPLSETTLLKKTFSTKKIQHRVFLISSFLTNIEIASVLEENGLGIVGDNLPESGRIRNSHTDTSSNNIYSAIAKDILSRKVSPTQNLFKEIIESDIEEMKKLGVEAAVFVTQKYCEPYEFLFYTYKEKLDKAGIRLLKISLSDSADDSHIRLSVEAFASVLRRN